MRKKTSHRGENNKQRYRLAKKEKKKRRYICDAIFALKQDKYNYK